MKFRESLLEPAPSTRPTKQGTSQQQLEAAPPSTNTVGREIDTSALFKNSMCNGEDQQRDGIGPKSQDTCKSGPECAKGQDAENGKALNGDKRTT